jgi:exodeoxyribonuclease V alpha subunit
MAQNPSLLQRGATGEVTVRGAVRTVTFRSDDLSFSVVRMVCVDGDEVVVVGPLGSLAQGECVRVTGRWEDHPSHGRRLRAQSVVPELPDTPGGIERLLGSGFVPDVGATLARRIVERFGSSTLDVIAEHPERLSEVGGIGDKRARRIQEAFRARRAEVESKAFLQGLGLGPALARKVWERFGTDTAAVIRDNPYRLAEEVAGIGFLTADRIGRAVGIADDDPRRIAGATLFLLLEAVEEGHTGLPPEELAVLADRFGIARAQVHEALAELAARTMVVIDKELVYPPPLYDAEVRLAADVGRMLRRAVVALPEAAWRSERVMAALETLHPLQREAVEATATAPMVVLTGGPGTGKTTTVRAMVALHTAAAHKVVLAAPTGRAAKRLSEATGHPAATLHRLLEWNPRLGASSAIGVRLLMPTSCLSTRRAWWTCSLGRRSFRRCGRGRGWCGWVTPTSCRP